MLFYFDFLMDHLLLYVLRSIMMRLVGLKVDGRKVLATFTFAMWATLESLDIAFAVPLVALAFFTGAEDLFLFVFFSDFDL